MEPWIEFILERYNYWIVIVLMMTGLYIVYARGNLVKKVVGLNLFQTSVFIFYITIGKIAGGTAPIYIGGELDHAAEGHGDGHGAADGGDHGADTASHDGGAADALHAAPADADTASKIQNTIDTSALRPPAETGAGGEALHAAPAGDTSKIANDILNDAQGVEPAGAQGGFDVAGAHGSDAGAAAPDAHHALGEVIYSNPLPHVLILTAIVVGVATTAVGLALAVRIREAYGTIEEDDLETMDNVAEFGDIAETRAS
ncbi:sodium:proton antiporter [Hyphococcus sp.]|uniref:sodium:proton antiporter n=1 Tax=Hyphococcus sp. TaxID=2038636 RepID=UPI003CCBA862